MSRQHAFPTTQYYDEKPIGVEPGMSLRDYFAAAALPEAVRQEATSDEGKPCLYDEAAAARIAYRLADAMLAERKKGPS